MAIKSRVVLPYLVPQLTAAPINTKALSILASVAGEALTKYLNKILPALLTALAASDASPQVYIFYQFNVVCVFMFLPPCYGINKIRDRFESGGE